MNDKEKQYYHDMEKIGRMIPIRQDEKLIGLITFYIGDDDNKFIRNNPWTILEDNPQGTTLYIDQFITNKGSRNMRMIFKGWREVKEHLKQQFPNIEKIKWSTIKGGTKCKVII